MAEPAYPLILPDRDDAHAWPAQGEWTYEDYRHLPDDGRRYEVIRGFLYVSPAPSVVHQLTVSELFWQLSRFVRRRKLGMVLTAPLDVLLPGGIAAPVQPDLMFFRKGNEPRAGAPNFQGVPDLVVEVLSPGTRQVDTRIKLAAYRDAGVPEVWFADPRTKTLLAHGLSEDGKSYVELSRGGEGESVGSRALPGLRIKVSEIFPRPTAHHAP
ncbi:MAG TPA: Uma2 family endonuclease [Thermoanaerobaculia bacterium]